MKEKEERKDKGMKSDSRNSIHFHHLPQSQRRGDGTRERRGTNGNDMKEKVM